jgi:hypothetical protein
MPVASLQSLCLRVLEQADKDFTDPEDSFSRMVATLTTAQQNMQNDQYACVELHTRIVAFYNNLSENPEILDQNPEQYLDTALNLGHEVAQRLAAMDPMVQWLGAVNDDVYAPIWAVYQKMYTWFRELQDELTEVIQAINSGALSPQ